jgi:hypothetical protein
MTETAPGMTPPHETPKRASHARIILMLALGGPVLAVGGCALFLANLNLEGSHHGSDGLSAAGGILFVAGCLAFAVGVLWAIANAILRRSEKAAAAKQAAGGIVP